MKRTLTFGLVVLLVLVLAVPALAEEVDEGEDNFYCENPEELHPVVQGIAERYGADYLEVLGYFCDGIINEEPVSTEVPVPTEVVEEDETGFGLGEIMLAFETSMVLDDGTTAGDLLALKEELGGWGEVWLFYGLIGPDSDAGPPTDAGPPVDVGKPDDAGPPDGTGKPDDAGPPDGAGKPDDAGPPAGAP